jgi:hypothetical protein
MGKLKWSLRDDVHQDVQARTPVGGYAVQVNSYPTRFAAIWYPSAEPIRIEAADLYSMDEAKAVCQAHYDHVVAQLAAAEGLQPVAANECVVDVRYVQMQVFDLQARRITDGTLGFDVRPIQKAIAYLEACMMGNTRPSPDPKVGPEDLRR